MFTFPSNRVILILEINQWLKSQIGGKNMKKVYRVGEPLEGVPRFYQEGVRFDMSDDGASFVAKFNNPTPHEVEQFKRGKIKLGYYTYKNVIMLLIKIGELEWMDAPYSVHLSRKLTRLMPVGEDDDLALYIALVDAMGGEIKALRTLGCNNRLTKSLFDDIKKQKEMSYEGYEQNMNYVFNTFSTKELVSRAKMIENLRIVE